MPVRRMNWRRERLFNMTDFYCGRDSWVLVNRRADLRRASVWTSVSLNFEGASIITLVLRTLGQTVVMAGECSSIAVVIMF